MKNDSEVCRSYAHPEDTSTYFHRYSYGYFKNYNGGPGTYSNTGRVLIGTYIIYQIYFFCLRKRALHSFINSRYKSLVINRQFEFDVEYISIVIISSKFIYQYISITQIILVIELRTQRNFNCITICIAIMSLTESLFVTRL